MAAYFSVLTEQMKIIAALMAIGFVEHRSGLFDKHLLDSLSAIIAKLILPLMLLTIIGSMPKSELTQGFRLSVSTALVYTLSIVVTQFFSRFSKLNEPEKSMHPLLECYGNSGYIGIPLILSIFPKTAGIAAASYTFVDSFFYWVVAPALAKKGSVNFKKIVSPMTLSIFAGFAIMLSGIDLTGFTLWDTMKNVGATCKYFASIYIGMTISNTDLKQLKANMYSLTAAPVKLMLIPLLSYIIIKKTSLLTGDYLLMFVMLVSTPSGMSLPIVADIAGVKSAQYASAGVSMSTVLSLFTIPLVMYIVSIF